MSKTSNLYSKMAAIMGEIQRVPKTGKNTQQRYDFATDSDIADLIRGKLATHNIALFAAMTDLEQTPIKSRNGADGYHTIAHLEFTLVCGDTGESQTMQWRGEADDFGDKGTSKAATLGEKYFLLKTFVMSTGDPKDDPDSTGVSEDDGVQRGKRTSGKGKGKDTAAALASDMEAELGAKVHWAKNPERAASFWNWATKQMMVPDDDVLKAFGVKRLSEITEDEEAAKNIIEEIVAKRQEQPDPKAA